MNISIDQIKALRATIELGAKGVTSLPLEEITPALREVIEQGSREINSLVNVLILLENPGIAKELDDLTEQCGVNTSNTFNTPPAPGKTQTPDPKFTPKSTSDPTAELSPAEFADLADQLEEEEPREPNPVEKLIDTVKMVFEHYPHLRLPIAMLTYAEEAQDFLDADTSLRERVKELEEELDGEKTVKTVLRELAKRLQADLDEERENKTD